MYVVHRSQEGQTSSKHYLSINGMLGFILYWYITSFPLLVTLKISKVSEIPVGYILLTPLMFYLVLH